MDDVFAVFIKTMQVIICLNRYYVYVYAVSECRKIMTSIKGEIKRHDAYNEDLCRDLLLHLDVLRAYASCAAHCFRSFLRNFSISYFVGRTALERILKNMPLVLSLDAAKMSELRVKWKSKLEYDDGWVFYFSNRQQQKNEYENFTTKVYHTILMVCSWIKA